MKFRQEMSGGEIKSGLEKWPLDEFGSLWNTNNDTADTMMPRFLVTMVVAQRCIQKSSPGQFKSWMRTHSLSTNVSAIRHKRHKYIDGKRERERERER